MTIVLQHQFWDLHVGDTTFEIGLSFNGVPEQLVVPFRAICAFVDPHASFGLKFDAEAVIADAAAPEPGTADERPESAAGGGGEDRRTAGTASASRDALIANDSDEDGAGASSADVVSLDAFRKKNG